MAQGRFVAYHRVSTTPQGRSGLGLEPLESAVMAYLNGSAWTLLATYVEVERGKNAARPQLAKAPQHCKLTCATLVNTTTPTALCRVLLRVG